MDEISTLVDGLKDRDHQAAYARFLRLREISRACDMVSPFLGRFAEMMEHESSYVRTRGLLLLAANAQWDTEHQIDEIIDRYLTHVTDPKPTVARQVIAALPELAQGKPELAEDIHSALLAANPGKYRDSMCPLIQGDIAAALRALEGMEAVAATERDAAD